MDASAVADDDAVATGIDLLVQPRVHERDVVALHVVVGVRLPVGRHLVRDLMAELELLHGEGLALGRERPERVEQRRRVGVEVDEHQTPPHRDGHRQQAELVNRKLGVAEVPRPLEVTVELVRPAVVAADEGVAAAGAAVDERARPMTAHVVERADLAVVARDHQNVPSAEVGGQVVARRLQLARAPDHQPFTPEQRNPLSLVDLGVVVPGGGQRLHVAIIPPARAPGGVVRMNAVAVDERT